MVVPLRIFLIDDDPDVVEIITPALQEQGYEVLAARDGHEALALLPEAEPDLLLIDVMMPSMDGFELTRRIRSDARFSRTPIMFISALDSRQDVQRAYELGVTVYLTKPLDIERLLKNIRICVEVDGLKPRPKKHALRNIPRSSPPQPTARTHRPPPQPATPSPPVTPQPHEPMVSVRRRVAAPRPPRSSIEHPLAASDQVLSPRRPSAPFSPAPPASVPVPATPAAPPQHSSPSPTPFPGGLVPPIVPQLPRVMIVEDDPDIIEVMTATLDQYFEVVTATDGLDAIKKIEDMQPDMFIIDLMMPRLNGYQLIHALRNTPAMARCPVLVVSAKSSRADQRHALAMGGNDFLAKPFEPAQLIEKLRSLTLQPGFVIASPKKKSLREIIQEETRRRIEEEEKRKVEEQRRLLEEEQKTDPFTHEEHVRRKRGLISDFSDLQNLFKKQEKPGPKSKSR